jgi:putative aldouronate transport system permease protein
MTLPGAAYLLINNYVPMAGVVIAFKNYNYSAGIWGSAWAGLDNFKFLFKSPDLFILLRNTILYNLAFIALGIAAGLALALLMDGIRSRAGLRIFQAATLLPYTISMVLVSYLVYALLHPENGFMNKTILKALGIAPVNWYFTPGPWVFILPLVSIWKGAGFQAIIYYASIIGIDPEIFEAATIDGAGKLKQIRHITLPLLLPVILIMAILAVGRIFNSDFGLFYQVPLNSSALYDTTSVIETYVYNALMKLNDIGMSSSVGLLQSAVGCAILLATNAIVHKIDPGKAMF